MCGRFASFRAAQDLADTFAVTDVADDARALPPSWNLAPTDPVRVVVERENRGAGGSEHSEGSEGSEGVVQRSLRVVRWGLVPGWATDPSIGSRMINARVETLTTKPAFRKAAATRRCLVPAEGYFEWQAPAAGSKAPKQPFWIHPDDGGPLAFAGLYEFWRDKTRADDDPLRWLVTMTIVTGGAVTDDPAIAAIHDRRPVILPPRQWDEWLDPAMTDPDRVLALLRHRPPALVARPVSTEVNRATSEGAQLIDAVEPAEPAQLDLPLG